MSIFYNKKEAELELINVRNYWIEKLYVQSHCISKTPLDFDVVADFKDEIYKDIEKELLLQELMVADNKTRKKLAFYSCFKGTMGYMMVWSKVIAILMYYAYKMYDNFPNKEEAKDKLSSMIFSQFFSETGLFSEMKESFFDYQEYVMQYLST